MKQEIEDGEIELARRPLAREWWCYVVTNDHDSLGFFCENRQHAIEIIDKSYDPDCVANVPVYRFYVVDGRDMALLYSLLRDEHDFHVAGLNEAHNNWLTFDRHKNSVVSLLSSSLPPQVDQITQTLSLL